MTQGSRTILVVEDDPQVRSLLNTMLENAGFEVIVAGDGPGALHQLWKRSGNLALLVTDIDMGRMNGIELCQAIVEEIGQTIDSQDVRVSYVKVTADERIPAVVDKRIDLAVDALLFLGPLFV